MTYVDTQRPPTPAWMFWTGWIVTLLPVPLLVMSAVMKFMNQPELAEGFSHLGWDVDLALGLGILEIASVIAYLIPRTAVLGAVLLTGYLGGAIATHVRVGDPPFAPFVLGMVIWLGLFLRDDRVRVLLPLRTDGSGSSFFTKFVVALVFIVVGFVAVVALQPAPFGVQRSATISAPASAVFAQVNDFHQWEAWSPWAKLDPNAKLTFEGPKAGKDAIFRWDGNDKVGQGSMLITESQPNERIKIKLELIKPYPGTSDVEFTFKEKENQTVVNWSMRGRHNLISKAMCLVKSMDMDKMIGTDYEEGLAKMKSVVEAKK